MAAILHSTTAAAAHDPVPAVELPLPARKSTVRTDMLLNKLASTRASNASGLAVLAIEDDPVDRFLLSEALAPYVELEFAADLDTGIALAWREDYDAVLLDLGLPARTGLDALYDFRAAGPDLPVIVLSGMYSDQLGVEALKDGAQDYLCKDDVGTQVILRSIRYAIERHVLQDELQRLAVLDPLTGLLNRRGFGLHGQQAITRAMNAETGLALLYLDVDGMKAINDTCGHAAGDQLLTELADVLQETVRSSDIVARVGGDEFCVLFSEGANASALAVKRLERAIDRHNRAGSGRQLAVSIGVARWDPESPCTFDELVRRADMCMLHDKASARANHLRPIA